MKDKIIELIIESIWYELEPKIEELKRLKTLIYWAFQIVINLTILIYLISNNSN